MGWKKITRENIDQIDQGDKIATGFPRSIINADSRTQAEIIARENINIFIVDRIERQQQTEDIELKLVKTIWSFASQESNSVTRDDLIDKWWWKPRQAAQDNGNN